MSSRLLIILRTFLEYAKDPQHYVMQYNLLSTSDQKKMSDLLEKVPEGFTKKSQAKSQEACPAGEQAVAKDPEPPAQANTPAKGKKTKKEQKSSSAKKTSKGHGSKTSVKGMATPVKGMAAHGSPKNRVPAMFRTSDLVVLESDDDLPRAKAFKKNPEKGKSSGKVDVSNVVLESDDDLLRAKAFKEIPEKGKSSAKVDVSNLFGLPARTVQGGKHKKEMAEIEAERQKMAEDALQSTTWGRLYLTQATAESYICFKADGKKTLLVEIAEKMHAEHQKKIEEVMEFAKTAISKEEVVSYRNRIVGR